MTFAVTLLATLLGTRHGVALGIDANNKNVEEQDKRTAIRYLQSASKEVAYQSAFLDEITGSLESVDYTSPADLARLEHALYYFDFAGIVLPYPVFSEKIIDDHTVLSRLSPTGINSIYRVQEQLKEEKNYILGKENRQQEYMLATKNYPPNLGVEAVNLVIDVSVRTQALSLYKKHLNILSKLLQREVDYIQGNLTADQVEKLDREEEKEELIASEKEIDSEAERLEKRNKILLIK